MTDKKVKRWEHLTESSPSSTESIYAYLDRCGREGWELVAVIQTGSTPSYQFFFKRRRRDLE